MEGRLARTTEDVQVKRDCAWRQTRGEVESRVSDLISEALLTQFDVRFRRISDQH